MVLFGPGHNSDPKCHLPLCVCVCVCVCKEIHMKRVFPKQERAEEVENLGGLVMFTPQVKAGWVDMECEQCPLPEVYPEFCR